MVKSAVTATPGSLRCVISQEDRGAVVQREVTAYRNGGNNSYLSGISLNTAFECTPPNYYVSSTGNLDLGADASG